MMVVIYSYIIGLLYDIIYHNYMILYDIYPHIKLPVDDP